MNDPTKTHFTVAAVRDLDLAVTRILYDLRQLARTNDNPQALIGIDEAIGFLQGAELSLREAAERMAP